MAKKITIIIEFEIYCYLLIPIIKEFQKRKIIATIYCDTSIQKIIKAILKNENNIIFENLSIIKSKTIVIKALHRTLSILFTNHEFSDQYKRHIKLLIRRGGIQKYIAYLSFITPKVKSPNLFLHNVISIFNRKLFPTNKVVVGSLNSFPELLCNKDHQIYTIMESWDHMVKTPNYYISDKVFLWNKELAEDWENHQKEKNVVNACYPLKLRYADNVVFKNKLYEKTIKKEKKCIYAFASTIKYSVPYLSNLEHKILEKICIATKRAGWELMIKPRPVGDKNEFDDILKRYENVSLGYMRDGKSLPSNYFLDDNYNKKRFDEVCDAQFLINIFTTFGLDAAVAGIPVLQVDIRGDKDLKDSKLFLGNHHIKKYLFNSENILTINNGEFLEDVIHEYLISDKNYHSKYSKELRSWLIDEKIGKDESIKNIINNIIEN